MIDFEHVSKEYKKGGRLALEDINLHVDEGEFVFLLGHSGAGKSTLLKLILREALPTSGKVTVLGKDVAMIHFKDFLRQDAGGQLAATGAGQGGMGDYRTILRFAKEQKPYVFATLENTTPENAVQCLQYLQKQYDEC